MLRSIGRWQTFDFLFGLLSFCQRPSLGSIGQNGKNAYVHNFELDCLSDRASFHRLLHGPVALPGIFGMSIRRRTVLYN